MILAGLLPNSTTSEEEMATNITIEEIESLYNAIQNLTFNDSTTSESSFDDDHYYSELDDEEEIREFKQVWDPTFVIFAYMIAFFSSYTAVHLLDHTIWFWRSEDLKKEAIIKHPDIYAACMLGIGTVWVMHFVGMAAVTLEEVPICYNWGVTMGSLVSVLVMMIAGIKIAGNDIFATPDRDQILNQILQSNYVNNTNDRHKFRIVAFHQLHFLIVGSLLAASGAVIMHYTGMMAQRGPFSRQWNFWLIGVSILIAIVICFVGFWIVFRLRWKIEQLWLRYASAAVIALAVCGLHFFGMISVTYHAVNDSTQVCTARKAGPNSWTSHQIVVFAIAICAIAINFIVESIINQELLMAYEGAARSNEIVSSLFPEQVRDRLLADNQKRKKAETKKAKSGWADQASEAMLADMDDEPTSSQHDPEADLPIAETFPETTILFADLAGFTKWSSTREPAQVFMLLENVYQAFDRIADRRGVFKIETIGDCYVAATGLPKPQPDHAIIMAKFARDCQLKMSQIIMSRLMEKLGEDTRELGFRVGMHSGPTTGGVLRGQKARFQLFGDTMNVASRMESNGVKGCIHVSEETANEIRAKGMGNWLTPRKDLIEVKGKGNMQTYFVNVTDARTETRSCLSGESSSRYHVKRLGHKSEEP